MVQLLLRKAITYQVHLNHTYGQMVIQIQPQTT